MRNFVNLDRARQAELTKQFPDLYQLACVEEPEGYKYLAVSVFDHWLGREDSIKLLDNVTAYEQERRNDLLRSFSDKVSSETEVLNFKFRGKWKKSYPLFREFTSEESKHQYFKPAISCSNKSFFRVVLPELDAVFFESWDDTNVLYLRNLSKEQMIRQWASECGVFCLEQ